MYSVEVDPHIPNRLPYKMDTPENSKIQKNIKVEKEKIRLRDRHLFSSEYADEYSTSLNGMFEGQQVSDDSSSSWFSIPKFRAGTRKIKKNKKDKN
jgi:hypothetical protein